MPSEGVLAPLRSGPDTSIRLAMTLGIDPEEIEVSSGGVVENQDGLLSGPSGPSPDASRRWGNVLDRFIGGSVGGSPSPALSIDHDPLEGVWPGLDAVSETRVAR